LHRRKIKYLGFLSNDIGVKIDQSKDLVIGKMEKQKPKMITELKRLLLKIHI
jgi:hypothetical protein